MDNRLGYLLMNEMSEEIRNKDNAQMNPIQISLYINGEFIIEGRSQKIIEYLSKRYATFMWFDKTVKQTNAYFNLVSWNIDMEENL